MTSKHPGVLRSREKSPTSTVLPNGALILQNHPPCASSSLEENIHCRAENSKTFEELLALTCRETKKESGSSPSLSATGFENIDCTLRCSIHGLEGWGRENCPHPSHSPAQDHKGKRCTQFREPGSKEWGTRRQCVKPDHGEYEWSSDPRGIPELHELPAEAEPKWQRETLAATGQMSGELVGSF